MLAHIQSAWSVKQVDDYNLSHLRVPISWPDNSSNGSPEPRKFDRTLFFIRAPRAQSIHQNLLVASFTSLEMGVLVVTQLIFAGYLAMNYDVVCWRLCLWA